MKKILYLHGLEGNLSEEKRQIIEDYGQCFGPDINYKESGILLTLTNFAKEISPTHLVGSSMGGYVGFIISKILNIKCLLFNPAFPYRSIEPDISGIEIPSTKTESTTFVLGKKDTIINYLDNFNYIKNQLNAIPNQKITEIENLEHRIPIDVFEKEIRCFLT